MNIRPLWYSLLVLLTFSQVSAQQSYKWAFTTNEYKRTSDFSDGLAIAQQGFKKGYINRQGQVHTPPTFNIIDAYSEGVASAGYTNFKTMDSESGFIDRTGNFVIQPQFEVTSPFQDGIACACSDSAHLP